MLHWNKALWLVKRSHKTLNTQSESFIWTHNSFATQKIIDDIDSMIVGCSKVNK